MRAKEKERQTQKDTMKSSAPQKLLQRQWVKQKQAQRDKQSDESLENFKKDDTFLSFAYQSNVQYNAETQVIFSFGLAAIVLEIIWHINHVDISFFSPCMYHCHMLSRGRPFVFQWALGKEL